MQRNTPILCWPAVVLALLMAPLVYAQTPSTKDRQIVARVAKEILEEVDPPPGWSWPPLVYIVNYEGGSIDQRPEDGQIDADEINADATFRYVKPGELPKYPSDTSMTLIPVPGFEPIVGDVDEDGEVRQPVIRIFQGWLTMVVQGDHARLANCFGHELQHILLGHVSENETGTPLIESAIQRQQETDADVAGFALALSAEYPYDTLFASLLTERDILARYTSFQAYQTTHPGYTDRVAIVAQHKQEVWRALSAFENGVVFLTSERYDMAADCFRDVIAQQPECYEAWANLGYAELMQYYEALGEVTLRSYDIGQLALGGYYNTAASMGLRGVDAKRWQAAADALQHALTLNPDLVVARANLAAAYLLHPTGKNLGVAGQEFAKVIAALEAGDVEEGVDPRMRAALLVNAGVAELADGDPVGAEALFAQARAAFESDEAFDGAGQVASAVRYNRALIRSRSSAAEEKRSAIEDYAAYLAANSSTLAWWSLAYEAYERLCRDAGVEPQPREQLAAESVTRRRLVTGVRLANGERLTLDEPMTAVEQSLGKGIRTNQVRDSNVHRRRFIVEGLDLWCNNRVLAIRLIGKKAPPLVLESAGAGPGEADELRVGMSFDDVQRLVGEDAKLWDPRHGSSFSVEYRYFYRLGFGVRVAESGVVTEIIVAQLSAKAKVGNDGDGP